MAAECTFLAWVRTGIAFMGLGFAVARFGSFVRELTLAGTSNLLILARLPIQPAGWSTLTLRLPALRRRITSSLFQRRRSSINKSQLGNQILLVVIGVISLPMAWLHIYTETGETVALSNRRVFDAHGYAASIEYYGFDVDLWLPVVLSIALSAILVLKGYGIVVFAKWQTDLMALVISVSILLPLWPCYVGKGYAGLGWYLGTMCAILTVREYITKFRNSQLN